MRKSFSVEIVITLLMILAGGLIHYSSFLSIIGGMVILLLTSYFLIPKLKEHTINEFVSVSNSENKKKTETFCNNQGNKVI